jgi:hypothetical protein
MKNKYRNPWHKDLNVPKPEFYENNAPAICTHRGVKVYKRHESSFDYVWQDVCITQRSGASKPRELIDAILDRREPISDQVKKHFPQLATWEDIERSLSDAKQ